MIPNRIPPLLTTCLSPSPRGPPNRSPSTSSCAHTHSSIESSVHKTNHSKNQCARMHLPVEYSPSTRTRLLQQKCLHVRKLCQDPQNFCAKLCGSSDKSCYFCRKTSIPSAASRRKGCFYKRQNEKKSSPILGFSKNCKHTSPAIVWRNDGGLDQ